MLIKKFHLRLFLFCCLNIVLNSGGNAQSAPNDIDEVIRKNENDRIRERQRLRQQELDEVYSKRLESAPTLPNLEIAPVDPNVSDSFAVKKFVFFISGHKRLPSKFSFLKKEVRRERIRYANTKTIDELIGRLTVKLFARGYVTTLLHAPEQDYKSGIIRIELIPGHVNKLIAKDPKNQRSFEMVLPRISERILNYRELENGVDRIERLRSHNTEFQIAPSARKGFSDVICQIKRSKRWSGSISIDDSYSKSLGEHTVRANYSYDNLFGLADFFSINGSTALNPPNLVKRYGYGTTFEIPWESILTSVSANWNYSSLPIGNNNTPSETKSLGLNFDWSIKGYRNKYFKSEFGCTFSNYFSHKFLGGVKEPVSSKRNTALALRYNAVWFVNRASFNATLSTKFALPWFNANKDSANKDPLDPTYAFHVYNLNLIYTNRGQLTQSIPFTWTTVFNAQYTEDILYNSEQFTIGSRYSVRGYGDEYSISAEKGFFLRNECAFPLKAVHAINPTLYLGIDYGKVNGHSNRYNTDNELAGAFIGMRARWKNINTNITWAEPLLGELSRDALGDRIAMNVSYSF